MKLADFEMGVQVHCLRKLCASNFEAALKTISDMGLRRVEMCYFPGCMGNPWGDFGYVSSCAPERIRDLIDSYGLMITGCHFPVSSLSDDSVGESISWAKAMGIDTVIVPAVEPKDCSQLLSWKTCAEALNRLGVMLSGEGMHLAYHTQTDIWRSVGSDTILSRFMGWLDPEVVSLELDMSGAVNYGADWIEVLKDAELECHAVHLRDAKYSGKVVPYLPSLPLGEGDVDWASALAEIKKANIKNCILEMEMLDAALVLPGLRQSMEYLSGL